MKVSCVGRVLSAFIDARVIDPLSRLQQPCSLGTHRLPPHEACRSNHVIQCLVTGYQPLPSDIDKLLSIKTTGHKRSEIQLADSTILNVVMLGLEKNAKIVENDGRYCKLLLFNKSVSFVSLLKGAE
jgi:hypothetical protein